MEHLALEEEPVLDELIALNTSYLMLARATAKRHPHMCYSLFGLAEAEANRLAATSVDELARIARSGAMLMRPRATLQSHISPKPEDSLRDIIRELATAARRKCQ
jgi:hypothetical protein